MPITCSPPASIAPPDPDLHRRRKDASEMSAGTSDDAIYAAIPSRTWQSVLRGLARGVRFSDNLVASARKPSV